MLERFTAFFKKEEELPELEFEEEIHQGYFANLKANLLTAKDKDAVLRELASKNIYTDLQDHHESEHDLALHEHLAELHEHEQRWRESYKLHLQQKKQFEEHDKALQAKIGELQSYVRKGKSMRKKTGVKKRTLRARPQKQKSFKDTLQSFTTKWREQGSMVDLKFLKSLK